MVFGEDLDTPIFGRLCGDCGHAEFSTSSDLVAAWIECPMCGADRRRR